MFRTKTLVILALMLFTLVTPVLATHADDEAESVGTASVQDDQATNDSVIISLTGIAPAGAGSSYLASLVSADGETILEDDSLFTDMEEPYEYEWNTTTTTRR